MNRARKDEEDDARVLQRGIVAHSIIATAGGVCVCVSTCVLTVTHKQTDLCLNPLNQGSTAL